MSKILISLLGTGKSAKNDNNKNEYEKTNYIINNTVYPDEQFVAMPIIKHFKIDNVFFIGTNKSMWDNIYESFGGRNEDYALALMTKKENSTLVENDLHILNTTIIESLGSSKSQCIMVENGESEEELWYIFERFLKIIEFIDKGDELYIDITHLFRSLSVMSFIMTEFAKTYKEFKMAGMFYGMLDSNNQSKIIDLGVFFELLDWSRAISNLRKFGNSYELKQLINSMEGGEELKKSFSDFSNALSISDVGAMQNSIKILKGKIADFDKHHNHIIQLISKDLKDFLKRFDLNSLSIFQFELARWYYENKSYAFSYISLAEACVSAICEQEGLNPTQKEDREEAKKILRNDSRFQQWKKVNTIRNNIAHKRANDGRNIKIQPNQSVREIETYIKDLNFLFKKK